MAKTMSLAEIDRQIDEGSGSKPVVVTEAAPAHFIGPPRTDGGHGAKRTPEEWRDSLQLRQERERARAADLRAAALAIFDMALGKGKYRRVEGSTIEVPAGSPAPRQQFVMKGAPLIQAERDEDVAVSYLWDKDALMIAGQLDDGDVAVVGYKWMRE